MTTPISEEEFEEVYGRGVGGRATVENSAVRALTPGTGVKFPCRWAHAGGCSFLSNTKALSRREGFTIRGRCKDGVVHIFRDG